MCGLGDHACPYVIQWISGVVVRFYIALYSWVIWVYQPVKLLHSCLWMAPQWCNNSMCDVTMMSIATSRQLVPAIASLVFTIGTRGYTSRAHMSIINLCDLLSNNVTIERSEPRMVHFTFSNVLVWNRVAWPSHIAVLHGCVTLGGIAPNLWEYTKKIWLEWFCNFSMILYNRQYRSGICLRIRECGASTTRHAANLVASNFAPGVNQITIRTRDITRPE